VCVCVCVCVCVRACVPTSTRIAESAAILRSGSGGTNSTAPRCRAANRAK
jgi:hypothetical protein